MTKRRICVHLKKIWTVMDMMDRGGHLWTTMNNKIKETMNEINYYSHKTQTRPYKSCSIKTALQEFKDGTYKSLVDQVRNAPTNEIMFKNKQGASAYTFSGTFATRSASSLITHSGFVCLDLDHLDQDVKTEKEQYQLDPYTYAVFLSISGTGLKILVKVPDGLDAGTHKLYYKTIGRHYNGAKIDSHAQDVCHLCFVTYDPELYLNEDSLVWDNPLDLPPQNDELNMECHEHPNKQYEYSGDEITDPEECIRIISSWTMGQFKHGGRNRCVHETACNMCEYGIPKENAYSWLREYKEKDFPETEIKATVDSAYRKTAFASKELHMEKPFSWQEKVFGNPKPTITNSGFLNSIPMDIPVIIVDNKETAEKMSKLIPDNYWHSTNGAIPSMDLLLSFGNRAVIICPRLAKGIIDSYWSLEIEDLLKKHPQLKLKVWKWWVDLDATRDDFVNECSIYEVIEK